MPDQSDVSERDVKVVCAWCGHVIRESKRAKMTSHMICEDCVRRLFKGGAT